jgi:hypothetical protein
MKRVSQANHGEGFLEEAKGGRGEGGREWCESPANKRISDEVGNISA